MLTAFVDIASQWGLLIVWVMNLDRWWALAAIAILIDFSFIFSGQRGEQVLLGISIVSAVVGYIGTTKPSWQLKCA